MSARHAGLVAVTVAAGCCAGTRGRARRRAVRRRRRRVAQLRRRQRQHQVLPAGSDRRRATSSDLRIAWRWQSVDGDVDLESLPRREDDRPISIRGLQATPLMIDGVLYLTTALYQAAAVDAGTGETLWVHDPRGLPGRRPDARLPLARPGVLERRRRRRPHLLGHERGVPDRGRRPHRRAGAGLRRQRPGRPDGGHPARGAGRHQLPGPQPGRAWPRRRSSPATWWSRRPSSRTSSSAGRRRPAG